ncbi:MAG TPA: TIGR00296 family protein [Patescibacteria group bacterium]|nr:TIGR00296 family protein [Patescibacteria group bacterium]
MSFELSQVEGEYIVRLARGAIEAVLGAGEAVNTDEASVKLREECGVFVTLNKVEGGSHSLRGCIGFPYPVKPLVEAIADSAVSAALRDPRFPPVEVGEMDEIVVEVSVLTPPEVIEVASPEGYPEQVEVGRDGLIVARRDNRGLLLPQVPVEWGWDAEEFLSQCCIKAWLPPDAWLLPGTEISKFRAIIFAEVSPRGAVERVELKNEG